MESISLYYPKKEIHAMDYGITVHISNTFIHNQKSNVINVCSYQKLEEHCMRILLDIRNKDSIVYSISMLALEKLNNGEHRYVVSKRLSERLRRILGVDKRGRIKLEKHDRELPIIYFIFLH